MNEFELGPIINSYLYTANIPLSMSQTIYSLTD